MDPMGYTFSRHLYKLMNWSYTFFQGFVCQYHPSRKDTDRIPKPTPLCALPCKKNPKNNTPSKKLTWTNFWRWHFYKKQPFQKPKSHRASKVTTSSPKKLQLATFPLSPFSQEFWGDNIFTWWQPQTIISRAMEVSTPQCDNRGGWLPLEPLLKKNLILPGPWKLPKTVGCDAETGEEGFRRDVGWFHWKGLLGSTWMFGWGLLGISG